MAGKKSAKKKAKKQAGSAASSSKGVKKMKVASMKSYREKKKMVQSINPATEEIMSQTPLMTGEEIDNQIERSRDAFRSWSATAVSERAALVKKLADHLRQEKRKYAELITSEMGKVIKESLAEIEKCAWLCEYYAENAERMLAPEEVRTENRKSSIVFQPLGVTLAIMPWNFPFWQAFRFSIPAITAGNVVLLKHASNVPRTALSIEDAFTAAGFPQDTFKTLIIDSAQALDLIDTDKVDAVSLTGSNGAGEQVGSHAGAKIKKLVLELGGSDPFIVLDDADVAAAGRIAANARMINAGQSCIAAKRFIVMDTVADEFRKHFIDRMSELKVGDPMDESSDVGPLARRDLVDALGKQLEDVRASGAEVVRIGNGTLPEKGYYFSPVVVMRPPLDSKVMKEEVFGPIAPIVVVRSEDEAVKIANDTEFGLGASVWSRDTDRAEKLAAKLECGFVAINDSVKSDPRLPFGGVKKSGIGRELSEYGLKEFVNVKTVVVKE